MTADVTKAAKALAQLFDAEWLQVKRNEDRRRDDQHIIRDLSKRYRELCDRTGRPEGERS